MIYAYILVFIGSIFLLYWSGLKLVKSLVSLCRFLKWKEFVVGFFVMSIATSLPNLFVDVNAAFQKIPQLAFGDIVGGNIVDLTLVIGIAVILSSISMPAESKMVQSSAFFTMLIVVMPLILIMDGKLDRTDGLALILLFFIYAFWLFARNDRFRKLYRLKKEEKKSSFLKNLFSALFFIALLLLASEGIMVSAKNFSSSFNISLPLVGILIVGLGNCAPETYFAIFSARKEQNWLILGNIMGSVIVCSTLVLGIVALISPFEITDFSPFLIARLFTIVSAVMFFVFLRTEYKITKKEGLALIFVYFAFLITEIYFK